MSAMLKAGKSALLWGAGIAVSVPLVAPSVLAEEKAPPSKMVKVSDMPIYDDTKDLYNIEYHVSEKGELEKGVSVVRKEVTEMVESTKELRDQAQHIYDTGKAHTAGQINYLMDEENMPARAGAIAVGGFVGLLLGARKKGRFFKKLIYTSAGAGAAAAALHPQQSKEIGNALMEDANTYANVAYNFAFGVKPGTSASSEPSEKKELAVSPPVEKLVKRVETDTVKRDAAAADQSNPADADMYTTRS